jgi:hypothetical protein
MTGFFIGVSSVVRLCAFQVWRKAGVFAPFEKNTK